MKLKPSTKNASHYKILDDVLDCFDLNMGNNAKSSEDLYINMYQISDMLVKRLGKENINIRHATHAIFKLEKEGYIERRDENSAQFNLTLEGELLVKSGGYVSMMNREIKDDERKDLYELIVVSGTGIAGIYVFVQIVESILQSISYWCMVSAVL